MKQKQFIRLLLVGGLVIFIPLFLLALSIRQRLSPKAAAPKAEVIIDPLKSSHLIDENFTVNVYVSTVEPVSGVNLVFSYKPDIVHVKEVKVNLDSFTDDVSPQTIASASGKIAISAIVRKAQPSLPRGKIHIGQITFIGVAAGNSPFTADTTSQVVGPGENNTVAVFDAFQLQEPTVTIEAGTGEPPKIAFSLRAYGITAKGPALPIKLRLKDAVSGISQDYSMTLTAKDNGIYSTDNWFSLTGTRARRSYSILIKGPKHLARVMEANRVLQVADNNENRFDWTDKPLRAGDVPNPNQNNTQDGVANAIDASLILERLERCDSDASRVGDLNFDGCVNLNDYSLFLATLANGSSEDDK